MSKNALFCETSQQDGFMVEKQVEEGKKNDNAWIESFRKMSAKKWQNDLKIMGDCVVLFIGQQRSQR